MAVDQLPGRVREFANYLNGLLARLRQDGGWCAVFWQRDPDGMRACLEGREVPPWDVVEALLQDLAAQFGAGAVHQEAERARALHTAALLAYDARPGGRDALGDRLDVMLREQRYAAERQAHLGRLLASATTRQEADTIRLDLAWARDDHERATARCAELRSRMAESDRRVTDGRAEAMRRGRFSQGAAYHGEDDFTDRADPSRDGHRRDPEGLRRDLRDHGVAGPRHGAYDAESWTARQGRAEAGAPWRPAAFDAGSPSAPRQDDPRTEFFGPAQAAPAQSAPAQSAPAQSAPARTTPTRATHGQGASTQAAPARAVPAAPVPGSSAPAPASPDAPALSAPALSAPAADSSGSTQAGPDAPSSQEPAPRQRKRRRGSARFAGMVEEAAAPVVVPPASGPVLPGPDASTGRTPRGARFAGGGEASAARSAEPRAEALDPEAAREVAEGVARLVRLRTEGRTGEAHALLVEAAYWPAARFPLLAGELQRAGLGADWVTLLWEAASLPAERLVAAADALVAAGRGPDGEQILRQGVARPAAEIGTAVLGLVGEGRRREVGALLDAYVRVRTPEEAARSAELDPDTLVPLLLQAARSVSDERHWDLVHALRVAGFAA
ncbi:hypothetical protein ABZT17_02870 [Streptomyces sp. NPDC005648]|uniref:hypothetical protein n=1 Tax=Streptomyces sp. NPDC005648 TaxID=3157044 RepID=UPI0033AF5CE4